MKVEERLKEVTRVSPMVCTKDRDAELEHLGEEGYPLTCFQATLRTYPSSCWKGG